MFKRDEEMMNLRLQGKTLQEIGNLYDVTRERVRQILLRLNIKKPIVKKEKLTYYERSKKRFLDKIEKLEKGCWEYTGIKTKTGYGQFSFCGVSQYAHRASYQLFNNIKLQNEGHISSETICVLHKCQNRSCVNPDHLYLGTQQDNARDRELDKIKNLK
jgi:hypothetical protein